MCSQPWRGEEGVANRWTKRERVANRAGELSNTTRYHLSQREGGLLRSLQRVLQRPA